MSKKLDTIFASAKKIRNASITKDGNVCLDEKSEQEKNFFDVGVDAETGDLYEHGTSLNYGDGLYVARVMNPMRERDKALRDIFVLKVGSVISFGTKRDIDELKINVAIGLKKKGNDFSYTTEAASEKISELATNHEEYALTR